MVDRNGYAITLNPASFLFNTLGIGTLFTEDILEQTTIGLCRSLIVFALRKNTQGILSPDDERNLMEIAPDNWRIIQ